MQDKHTVGLGMHLEVVFARSVSDSDLASLRGTCLATDLWRMELA